VKFINENIFSHGSVKIPSLINTNRSVQELWDLTSMSSIPTLAFVGIYFGEGGGGAKKYTFKEVERCWI
jgi:hypothetical protein